MKKAATEHFISVEDAQKAVDGWIKSIGKKYFSELTNLSLLMEEVGELARAMSRAYGDQIPKKGEENLSLKEELADIFFVLLCLCNQTGVDLSAAFAESIEKKTKRDGDRFSIDKKNKI